MTVDTWSEQTAKMILQACKSGEGADVTLIRAAKIVISLLAELEFGGQDLPGYGSGWLELLGDYVADRLASDR